jgi:tetratricopeptide (TPR) repeat protein
MELNRVFILFYLIFLIDFGVTGQKKKNDIVIPQTQKDSLKVESVLIEGEKQLIIENYTKALESFMVALEMNSESAAINAKIAEVFSETEEGQKGIPYALRAIELEPDNKFYRLFLARLYQSVGFYIDAAKTYEELIEEHPSEENALYELAELYQLTGRIDDMFKTFDKIEQQFGVREEIVREKQRIYMKEGKLDEAIREYEKLVEAFANRPSYHVEFVSFLIQNKKLDKAEKEIAKLEELDQIASRVTLLKSELYWMQGDVKLSLELLKEAFQTSTLDFDTKFQILSNYVLISSESDDKESLVDVAVLLANQYPDEFKAQAFAGDMLNQTGSIEQSLFYYRNASRLNAGSFTVWQNILNAESSLQQYDSLIVHAEEALEYFPNQAILYYFAGTGYLIKNEYNKSIRLLELGKKFTIDPNLLTIFYGQLGDAYNGIQNNEQSFASYEKALQNNPDNDHVLNNYSYFLSLEKQNLEKARNMSERLVDLYPENATYLDTHGWVLYTMGEYKESKKFLQKAAELEQDGTILEHYGDVLFQLGDKEEALTQWELARELGNTSDLIDKKISERKLYE